MHIPVLVELVANNGYRASVGPPFAVTAEGTTREEALQKLRQMMGDRLAGGAEVIPLEVPEENSGKWREGMFKDDPLFAEWQRTIAELRRQADEDPDYL